MTSVANRASGLRQADAVGRMEAPPIDLLEPAVPALLVESASAAVENPAAGPHPSLRGRLARWARILSAYFTAQTLTQATSIAAGLLLVRSLPVREFALYTLAFSVISFLNVSSDLGSSTSLVYFSHRTAREGGHFPDYLAAVFSLRREALLLGAGCTALAFPLVAAAKGFQLSDALFATAAILACVWFQLNGSLRLLALRLSGRFNTSYRAEIAGGSLRLVLAATMVAFAWLRGWIGVLTAAAASGTTSWLAREGAAAPPSSTPALRAGRRSVLRYLLPTLPAAAYFAVQGPLVVWLSATFGSARNIAEVGALGRLGFIVGIFSNLTGVVFLPRLARIVDGRFYLRRYLQFGGLLAGVAAFMTLAAAFFPDALLLLIGHQYAGLDRELLVVVAASGLQMLDGYAVNVNLARSWTRLQAPALLVQIAIQAVLVAMLPLSSTANVLLFNLLSSAAALGLQAIVATMGFRRPSWVHWS